jgi:tetratricopeptide (TPR) repeat protein
MDSTGLYSVIRHTRLLDTSHGIAVLVETAGGNETDLSQYPLLDLELTRRNLDTWPPARTAAEVWLLVSRHPADEAIYRWAAWYFEHRRLYAEAERLLNDAVRNGFSGDWIALHRALAFMRSGDIAEGERILRELGVGAAAPDWRVFANLARIYEGRRLFSSALAAYETAAVLVSAQRVAENAAAAQVQMRLSRNMEALGQRLESRIALERALELDPDNLAIRRELRRWE